MTSRPPCSSVPQTSKVVASKAAAPVCSSRISGEQVDVVRAHHEADHAAMGDDHALGLAGRPRRVHDVRRVQRAGVVRERRLRAGCGGGVQALDPLEPVAVPADEQQPRAAVGEQALRPPGRMARLDRHVHGTRAQHREHADHPRQPARHPQAHPVAGAHAARAEGAGEARGALVERAVAACVRAVDDRDPVAVARCGEGEELRDGGVARVLAARRVDPQEEVAAHRAPAAAGVPPAAP